MASEMELPKESIPKGGAPWLKPWPPLLLRAETAEARPSCAKASEGYPFRSHPNQ